MLIKEVARLLHHTGRVYITQQWDVCTQRLSSVDLTEKGCLHVTPSEGRRLTSNAGKQGPENTDPSVTATRCVTLGKENGVLTRGSSG